jgi:MoaA/NifB/PqqE/SkfB family radical SAM enzyme
MACRRCYGHLPSSQNHPVMSLETAQKATRLYFTERKKGVPLSYIMLFGGEPLLNWDLIRDYIPWVTETYKEERFRIFLFTNGLLLNDVILEFLGRFHVLIFLSLDGDYEQHVKNRPVTRDQYDRIIDHAKKHLGRHPRGMIPYAVIRKADLNRFENIVDFLVSLGFDVIAVSKEIGERMSMNDRWLVLKRILQYRFKKNVRILPYPEVVCNCHNCAPRNAMVYPDGNVFDLCYVSGSVWYHKGCTDHKALEAFYMGHQDRDPAPFFLDHARKRKLLMKNGTCPIVSGWISRLYPLYHWLGKDIIQFYEEDA